MGLKGTSASAIIGICAVIPALILGLGFAWNSQPMVTFGAVGLLVLVLLAGVLAKFGA